MRTNPLGTPWLSLGLAVISSALAGGCVPTLHTPDPAPLSPTFAVSDIYSPSGFMGEGASFGQLQMSDPGTNCKLPRPDGARGYCYTFTYYKGHDPDHWAGVYWVFPTNSWGYFPGHAI